MFRFVNLRMVSRYHKGQTHPNMNPFIHKEQVTAILNKRHFYTCYYPDCQNRTILIRQNTWILLNFTKKACLASLSLTIVLSLLSPDEHRQFMSGTDDCGHRQGCVWDPAHRVKLKPLFLHSLVDETWNLQTNKGSRVRPYCCSLEVRATQQWSHMEFYNI